MLFRIGLSFLCAMFLAAPGRAGEFAPTTFTNLQAQVSGAWLGEPAHRVNDSGEIIGGGTRPSIGPPPWRGP